jgi:hypothetical protein
MPLRLRDHQAVVPAPGAPSPATVPGRPRAGRPRTRSAALPSGDAPGAARTPAPRPQPAAASARPAAAASRRAARRSRPPRTCPATSRPTASRPRTAPRPRSPATRPAPPSPPGTGARPATQAPDRPLPPSTPRAEMITRRDRGVKHLLRTERQACREPLQTPVIAGTSPIRADRRKQQRAGVSPSSRPSCPRRIPDCATACADRLRAAPRLPHRVVWCSMAALFLRGERLGSSSSIARHRWPAPGRLPAGPTRRSSVPGPGR